jgi:hypothetical protein
MFCTKDITLDGDLMIKNTFFDVLEQKEGSASRRTSSEPAGFRSTMKEEDNQDDSLCRVVSWADASTDASDDEESLMPSSGSGTDTEDDIASDVPPPPSPAASARTPLSSKAMPWQPSFFVQDCSLCTFDEEVTRIVTEAKQALEISGLTSQVDVMSTAGTWLVSVRLTNEAKSSSFAREQVMSVAQSSLLSAAAESSRTYILGYLSEPFASTKSGFNAVLGEMMDASRACMSAYGMGHCPHGKCCSSLHPESKMLLSFMLR